MLMGEGGDESKTLGKWDRRGAKPRSGDKEGIGGVIQQGAGFADERATWG